jgi:pimeloyl-ACP methyl ester carboxylesterase
MVDWDGGAVEVDGATIRYFAGGDGPSVGFYKHFPPKGFDGIAAISRRVPPIGAAVVRILSTRPGRKFFIRSVTVHPPTRAAGDKVFESFAASKAAREDALTVTQSLEPSVTLDAVDALRVFAKPVVLAWGDKDKLFPIEHAQRLHADFPNATVQIITDASTYVMVDRPDQLAAAITKFARASGGSGDGANSDAMLRLEPERRDSPSANRHSNRQGGYSK